MQDKSEGHREGHAPDDGVVRLEGIPSVVRAPARLGAQLEAVAACLDAESLRVVQCCQALEKPLVRGREAVVGGVVRRPESVAADAGEGVHLEDGVQRGAGLKGCTEGSLPCKLLCETSDEDCDHSQTSLCQPAEVRPFSANEIWRPSLSGVDEILPSGRPFSLSSCVGWMCSVESSGLPASSPRRRARRPISSGTMSSCFWKKTTPRSETGKEIEGDGEGARGDSISSRSPSVRSKARLTEDGQVAKDDVALLLGEVQDLLEADVDAEAVAQSSRELLALELVERAGQLEGLDLEFAIEERLGRAVNGIGRRCCALAGAPERERVERVREGLGSDGHDEANRQNEKQKQSKAS